MASKIEWTGSTWNPLVGCSLVSPGCTNCYAMKMAARLTAMGVGHYAGTVQKTKAGPVWTGQVNVAPDHIVAQPLRWKRPRVIFVNSMSDLFHRDVSRATIARIWAVMALTPHHQYQVLTKRPDRMHEIVSQLTFEEMAEVTPRGVLPITHADMQRAFGLSAKFSYDPPTPAWPLKNVWLGASVEDQTRADERREDLGAIAAAGWTTFVSYEPALGPVDWTGWEFLRWLISGGESGPRPSHPDWHRDARDFCAEHAIAYFFKQWGTWAPGEASSYRKTLPINGAHWDDDRWDFVKISAAEGAHMHVDDEPPVWKVGKSHSGRLLDGVEHNAMPAVAHD